MRTAKQQAEELEQAGSFLNSILTSGSEPPEPMPQPKEAASRKQPNGRSKTSKIDHISRFAEPPAPPPQHPLPEKPDSSKSSPVSTSFTNLLKRTDTAKSPSSTTQSPTNPQNSQMLSLIEALSFAKKELDSQGARVKQLEDMLHQERSAREEAEERARRLEQHAGSRPVSAVEEEPQPAKETEPAITPANQSVERSPGDEGENKTKSLEHNLEEVLGEMQRLKTDVDNFRRRAETAEADAANARKSLTEMIDRIREENEREEVSLNKSRRRHTLPEDHEDDADVLSMNQAAANSNSTVKWPSPGNGHIGAPRLPAHVERAVATVLRDRSGNADSLAQSAPYVSMLGVVLIGVGLMAYLNSWQKSET